MTKKQPTLPSVILSFRENAAGGDRGQGGRGKLSRENEQQCSRATIINAANFVFYWVSSAAEKYCRGGNM